MRDQDRKRCAAALAAAVCLLKGQAVFADGSTWVSATSGDWTDSTKWTTNPISPNNGNPIGTTYDAIIGAAGGSYTVSLGAPITINSLTLNSASATLLHTPGSLNVGTIDLMAGTYRLDGGTLTAGSITGAGSLQLQFGVLNHTTLSAAAAGTYFVSVPQGLTLDGGSVRFFTLTSDDSGLDFQAGQSLLGTGTIIFDHTNTFWGHLRYNGTSGTFTIGDGITVRSGQGEWLYQARRR